MQTTSEDLTQIETMCESVHASKQKNHAIMRIRFCTLWQRFVNACSHPQTFLQFGFTTLRNADLQERLFFHLYMKLFDRFWSEINQAVSCSSNECNANIYSSLRPRTRLARVSCKMRFLIFRLARIGMR